MALIFRCGHGTSHNLGIFLAFCFEKIPDAFLNALWTWLTSADIWLESKLIPQEVSGSRSDSGNIGVPSRRRLASLCFASLGIEEIQ